MTHTLYTHAGGAKLTFDGHALIATDETGKAVSLPMVTHELRSLGATMMKAEDPGADAEDAGGTLGHDRRAEAAARDGRRRGRGDRCL